VATPTSTIAPAFADLQAILGAVQLGRDSSGKFALTLGGIAVLRPNGTYLALDDDSDELIDVSPLVLPGVDPIVVRLPTHPSKLRRGDLVIVSDAPFSPLFVVERRGAGRFQALDPIGGLLVEFAPPLNLFFDFIVQAVSLFDVLVPDDHGDDRR